MTVALENRSARITEYVDRPHGRLRALPDHPEPERSAFPPVLDASSIILAARIYQKQIVQQSATRPDGPRTINDFDAVGRILQEPRKLSSQDHNQLATQWRRIGDKITSLRTELPDIADDLVKNAIAEQEEQRRKPEFTDQRIPTAPTADSLNQLVLMTLAESTALIGPERSLVENTIHSFMDNHTTEEMRLRAATSLLVIEMHARDRQQRDDEEKRGHSVQSLTIKQQTIRRVDDRIARTRAEGPKDPVRHTFPPYTRRGVTTYFLEEQAALGNPLAREALGSGEDPVEVFVHKVNEGLRHV